MRGRKIVGFACILLGSLAWLYLGYRLVEAYYSGVFYNLMTDSPITPFQKFSCPRIMNLDESGMLEVSILNSSGEPRKYRPEINTPYFQVVPVDSISDISVPDGGSIQLRYVLTPTQTGTLYLQLTAYADKNPPMGSFGDYSRSFRQSCGVVVMPPWTAHAIFLFGLACVLGGGWAVFARRSSGADPQGSAEIVN